MSARKKPASLDLSAAIHEAWTTNDRVTGFLVASLPETVWRAPLPGESRRTVRSIAAHLHNSRCHWIRTLGAEFGIAVPASVDPARVTRRQLSAALNRSSRGMLGLIALGAGNGGRIPASSAYTWRNLPLDLGHFLAYFAAHEGHHRGQIVMAARQLGHRLPVAVTGGLWQFTRLSKGPGGRRRRR
ncbi:MAG TPA: DinB family protein [Thermoanaerobaculia bacterium]|nr:DinB family protein [Thermoanaerobaculia bacterium]